jgi:S1-C subfamily serine protease
MGPVGRGFAIPINHALAIGNQIRGGARSAAVHIGAPAMLGVGVSTRERQGGGVLVQQVLRGGPAEQVGLADGDVLIAVDGTSLDSATALTYALDRHYPGDVIDVTWLDASGAQRNGKATLSAGP